MQQSKEELTFTTSTTSTKLHLVTLDSVASIFPGLSCEFALAQPVTDKFTIMRLLINLQ